MEDNKLDGQLIKCAAIRHGELIFSMPRPNRHHHIIRAMVDLGVPTPIGPGQGFQQGFLNATGGFRDRQQSAILVGKTNPCELFSEDLW